MKRIKRRFNTIALITALLGGSFIPALAQGKLMLAGGAGEAQGGWSDAPYKWVVEQTKNKRIAVISYNTESEWIPDYFKSFGAVEAKNFYIPDRITADQQWLYDSLTNYDGVFIKGGNQWIYYDRYKNTKTQEALQNIYDRGGVLSGTSAGMAILSPIVFTAQIASVDPGQAQLNAYSAQMTLEDDFLNTLSERFIYDTHFAERGRFGRLPSFMASWYKKTREVTIGIGVDDHTAFCIDTSKIAKIYGTGAVSVIYNNESSQAFDTLTRMLRAQNMKMSQLIHGNSIDLNNGMVSGLGNFLKPPVGEENGRHKILFSGTDYPSDDAYTYFINSPAFVPGEIAIITGASTTRAGEVKTKLISLGAQVVHIIQATFGNSDDPEIYAAISGSGKFFFIENNYADFMNFMRGTSNGSALLDKISGPGVVSFFAGDNARFAGKTVIDKYKGFGYTSYRGTLEFLPGLSLLETTAIMPNTFIDPDSYENTVTGLPYAMVKDSLSFGLYLTGNTLAEYSYTESNHSFYRNVVGSFPLIVLKNNGTFTDVASQGPYEKSRNIAGFETMDLRFMGLGDTIISGKNVPVGISPSMKDFAFQVFPNPVTELVTVQAPLGEYSLQIIDALGRKIRHSSLNERLEIDTSGMAAGIYIFALIDEKTKSAYHKKIFIRHNPR